MRQGRLLKRMPIAGVRQEILLVLHSWPVKDSMLGCTVSVHSERSPLTGRGNPRAGAPGFASRTTEQQMRLNLEIRPVKERGPELGQHRTPALPLLFCISI